MTGCDLPDHEVWEHFGFTEDQARAWVGAASYRFTPYTARARRPRTLALTKPPCGPRRSSIRVPPTSAGRLDTAPSTRRSRGRDHDRDRDRHRDFRRAAAPPRSPDISRACHIVSEDRVAQVALSAAMMGQMC